MSGLTLRADVRFLTADAGEGDLLDLVGFPLPVRVIGELVGVVADKVIKTDQE
jgi:hypothetical protein